MNRALSRIVVAGGTGFLGQRLMPHLATAGYQIVALTRRAADETGSIPHVRWDGGSAERLVPQLEGARAVINLAGRSVNCRHGARNRRQIMDSRVGSTRAIGEAIRRCSTPPRVWLNASTATIYRHTFDPAWDEAGEIGSHPDARDAFSIEVARAWENALAEASAPATRKVALRTAMVLGTDRNSVFPVLRRLVRLGLGGRMGHGRQFVSWIHEHDFCRAVQWLLEREDLHGPVNLAAPSPVPNAEMMRILRGVCGVPAGLPAARWMLELGAFVLRTESELILKSRRVTPRRLLESGFTFRFPQIRQAFEDLEARTPR